MEVGRVKEEPQDGELDTEDGPVNGHGDEAHDELLFLLLLGGFVEEGVGVLFETLVVVEVLAIGHLLGRLTFYLFMFHLLRIIIK